MIRVTADFETANTAGVDLTVVGAEVYAAHWATEVLCLVVKEDDHYFTWMPNQRTHITVETAIADLAFSDDAIWDAHNASFEMAIWRHIMVGRFGFPPIPIERWDDTMAVCAVRGLPLGSDKGAK